MKSRLRTPGADSRTQTPAVEMTIDVRFDRRVIRLALESAVVHGFIWFLATAVLEANLAIRIGLLGGWVLMPLILGLSLRRPVLRYALVVPSSLVGLALLAICVTALPGDRVGRAGWVVMTAGVLLGGVLGVWFWFRWAPVPSRLHDPFSRGRLLLVGIHVSLIVSGILLAGVSALA